VRRRCRQGMTPARSRTALVAAVATALAVASCLAATGCGSSSTVLDPVAQAAAVTSHAGGAHMAIAVDVQAPGLAEPITMNGQGFFNYGSQEGELTMDMSGLPAGAAASLPSGPLHIEEIFKASSIYVGSSLFAGKLPGGARWMKLDLGRLTQAVGLNLQQLAGQSNPAQFLQYLRATAGSVTPVGSELVRGVPTTHYRATIDLERVADVVPSAERSQLRAAISKLIAQMGTSKVPVDAWIDNQRLVRRIAMSFQMGSGSVNMLLRVTVELFDFGATPPVSTPASSETFDATQTALSGLSARGG
jgi:hypothetical protein